MNEASRDLSLLAPKFREAVEAAIQDCAAKGYPVKAAEALRSQERQAWLYAQGRTRPGAKVTNASTNLTSWHGYGLAVDVIHATLGYNPPEVIKWFRAVAAIFKAHGCSWGGDWSKPDMPHMQWGNMPASPGVTHKAAKQSRGNSAVWRLVGAIDEGDHASESAAVRTLRKGMEGDDVKALQEKLHALMPSVVIDGSFGPATEAAVINFQNGHGLARDGVVGKATRAALGIKE